MPYPSQINRETILETARTMIETGGADELSLHKLAAALNVKAPSLYRYFANKTDLIRAINITTAEQLTTALYSTTTSNEPVEARLQAMGNAYRTFAHAHPAIYTLLYTTSQDELRPADDFLLGLALPLQALFAEYCGEAHSLAALRGAWALLHGFVTLEINQQFRRSASVDTAFEQAYSAYLAGWKTHF